MDEREELKNYDKAKKLLFLDIMPVDDGIMQDYPTMVVGDVMLICRVLVEYDLVEDRIRAIAVDNEMLEGFKVTKEQMFDDAAASMEGIFKPSYMDISPSSLMVTTDFGFRGASVVFCRNVQEELLKRFPGGFYLVFGSLHGVLVSGVENGQMLLRKVAKKKMEKEDHLSGRLYWFNRDTKKIEEVE